MTDVKIKCDDCKFVENCVDYGWEGCKKFTPKPSELMTKLCNSCEYLKYCARSGIEEVGCDRYKRDTTTNEEYLRSLNTEQLAWMISLFVGNAIAKHDCGNDEDVKPIKWVEWLKEIHQ